MKYPVVLFVAMLLSGGVAVANDTMKRGESQKLTINGGVQMGVADTNSVNAATGLDATADQEHFAIESGNIRGDVAIDGTVTDAVNAATGKGTTATQKIGVIGK
ncbi:MAG: hypothetical protein JW773_13885 [Desulfuromonadales bacterium]|nr:hypothetical protein [Desulfuromonadales bacterium]